MNDSQTKRPKNTDHYLKPKKKRSTKVEEEN